MRSHAAATGNFKRIGTSLNIGLTVEFGLHPWVEVRQGSRIKPRLSACVTACVRSAQPSLAMMWLM
jgi:hypothetical protein